MRETPQQPHQKEKTMTLFHGTSAKFDGTPTIQTDINGLIGIFMTALKDDAILFAEANTEGKSDGKARIFEAEVSEKADIYDISEKAWEEGWEHDDIVFEADNSDSDIVILPDMSGMGEVEYLIKNAGAIKWVA